MSFKGIILAAGRGSRMQSLTDNEPKCMVKLDGQMLLDWQEQSLQEAGISDIHLVGGYRAESLPPRFPKFVNTQWNQTNMVSSLLEADSLLSTETCIVSYSDIVYASAHVVELCQAEGDICITYDSDWYDLWSLRFEDPLEDAETFQTENGQLQSIGAKTDSLDDIKGQYMGLLKFTPTGWSAIQGVLSQLTIEQCKKLDMTSLLSMLLQQNISVTAVQVTAKWCEVDSDEDLALYHSLLDQEWKHNWR
jgi:L-glutamine-phosphate cytidylyltransferase